MSKYRVNLSLNEKKITKNVNASAIKMVETYVVDQLILENLYKMDLRELSDIGGNLHIKYLRNDQDAIMSENMIQIVPGKKPDRYSIEIQKDESIENAKTFVFYSELIEDLIRHN